MDEHLTESGAWPIAPAKEPLNPELTSVKRVLALLDKTAKSRRTYGTANPVAQKFFQELFEGLTAHLATYSKMAFLIQRSELYFNGEVVYQAEQGSSNESVAFKLYADGIRELAFLDGLSTEDLSFLLDSLWGSLDPEEDDDDIVTRLWSKNLSTITMVTAEEIAKASTSGDVFALSTAEMGDVFTLPTAGMMEAPESSLRDLLDREQARAKMGEGAGLGGGGGSETGTGGSPAGEGTGGSISRQASRFKSGHAGYEVSDKELAELAKEIEAESARDNMTYLLDMLTAILASEKSPAILTKLLDLWGNILDSLTAQGKWTVLDSVLGLLHVTVGVRPDLNDDHKKQLAVLLDNLGRPEHMKMIETYLNKTPDATTEGLPAVLLSMTPAAVSALCTLLGNLEAPTHQAIVAEALETLAKDQPDHVLRGLSDRRPRYVKNLLAILLKWNNPRFADAVERLVRYPDMQVRKEVVRAIGIFRPNGNGTKLVAFLNDTEESVRFAALKLLMTGHYTAPYSTWSPLVSAETFMDRNLGEKRAVFQALRATSGDEVIPFFESLLTERSWTNRKKKEELAILAAEALGKFPTPAALTALELGQKKGGGATVRQACIAALAQAQRQQQLKQAAS
ncbi:MAG: HEAT repeat domain-containing protein [Nitrospirae bacterium]|nr:HEAT repeat domain-containing protein [Nitrospirota bacterium]